MTSLFEKEKPASEAKPDKKKPGPQFSRRSFLKFGAGVSASLATSDLKSLARAAETANTLIENDSQTQELFEKMYQERYAFFLRFQERLERDQIFQKFIFLEQVFGEAMQGFSMYHRIKTNLKLFEYVSENKEEKETFVNKEDPKKYVAPGGTLANFFVERWDNKFEAKSKELTIGEIPNVDPKILDKKLAQLFPEFLLKTGITEIKYIPQIKWISPDESSYALGEVQSVGMERMLTPGDSSAASLNIYKRPPDEPPITEEDLTMIIAHENGHLNDWSDSDLLNNFDRINMLWDVLQRYQQPNHFRSPYVEEKVDASHIKGEISDKDLEKKYVLWLKTTEYWAELMKEYLINKEHLKENYPEDYELVSKWLNLMEKNYIHNDK